MAKSCAGWEVAVAFEFAVFIHGEADVEALRGANWDALRWRPTPDSILIHDLWAGEDVVATLNWTHNPAVGETREGSWNLARHGVILQSLLVQSADGTGPQLVVKRDWHMRWYAHFPEGLTLRWHLASLASPHWVCDDAVSERLMVILVEQLGSHRLNLGGQVQLSEGVRSRPELPLMVLIGWFLVLIANLEGGSQGGDSGPGPRILP